MKTFMMTVAAAAMIAGGAQAATVNYNESASGDLGSTGSPSGATDLGTFEIGNNFVFGTTEGTCDANNCFSNGSTDPDDADSFLFTVAAGTEVTAMSIGNEKAGTATDVIFSLFMSEATAGAIISGADQDYNENDGKDFLTGGDTFGPGTYFVFLGAFESATPGTYEQFYDFSATVASTAVVPPTVPLPASLPLLLAGMGALGIARRKRG